MRNHSNVSQVLESSNSQLLSHNSVAPTSPSKIKLAIIPAEVVRPAIQMMDAQHPQRHIAEGFIKGIFKEHHDATISNFLPSLFAAFNEQGKTQSALGLKGAEQGSLYLESYLNDPIENLLEKTLGQAIQRSEVVEIGNLASQNSASCKALFAHITQHLQDQDVKWITCTGTATLRVVFKRLGIKALAIHKADQNRLGDEQYSWGNYYQNDPQVMLINVSETNQHFINLKAASKKISATY